MDRDQLEFQDLLSPQEYVRRARDFYSACRCLPNFHSGFIPMWPPLALFGLAIELLLKGFLLSQGETAANLKKIYGHKLQKLHERALDLGLPKSDRTERMIGFIDDTYSAHIPRYPDPETRHRPIATVPQFFEDYDKLVLSITEAMA